MERLDAALAWDAWMRVKGWELPPHPTAWRPSLDSLDPQDAGEAKMSLSDPQHPRLPKWV